MKGLKMSDKIRFADLVNKIAEETGTSKQVIRKLFRETVNLTKEGLKRDGRVNISGLGHFDLKWHAARPGRNPSTGEDIEIAAQNKVTFKAEASLRNFINRKYKHLEPEFIEDETKTSVPYANVKQGSAIAFEADTQIVPVDEQITIISKRKSKKNPVWLWFIVPLIMIAIIFILWSLKDRSEPVADSKSIPKSALQEAPITVEAPSQPIEKTVSEKAGIPGAQHSMRSGDTIWNIADTYYKEAYLWPNIYRANLTEIENPDYLSVGLNIQVPALEGNAGSLTNNDRANIAEGYIHAYLIYKKLKKVDANNYLWVASQYDATEIFNQFSDKIDEADLKRVKKIEKARQVQ